MPTAKTILVTGATGGIGLSVSRRLAKAGYSLVLAAREVGSHVPLRKYGAPDEVAAAVEGLLSDFTDHMTGINVLHDGGFTKAY